VLPLCILSTVSCPTVLLLVPLYLPSFRTPLLSIPPLALPGPLARLPPFIGTIGTTPGADLPDSHNAGDFGNFLVGARHPYGMSLETLNRVKTDAHLDTNEVRPGAILICPVKIDGGGVYISDCHANEGDG